MMLNIGAGETEYGDVRLDVYRSQTVNIVADAEFLPFRGNSFDLIYSRNVLEHLPNPLNALREQKRVCKEGGRISIITDNAGFWAYHILGHHTRPVLRTGERDLYHGTRAEDRHYFLFTREHLQNLLGLAGLRIIRIDFMDFGTTKADLINKFLRCLPFLRNFSHPRIIAVAHKNHSFSQRGKLM
jgi:SAM-dependent methyltransferase